MNMIRWISPTPTFHVASSADGRNYVVVKIGDEYQVGTFLKGQKATSRKTIGTSSDLEAAKALCGAPGIAWEIVSQHAGVHGQHTFVVTEESKGSWLASRSLISGDDLLKLGEYPSKNDAIEACENSICLQ